MSEELVPYEAVAAVPMNKEKEAAAVPETVESHMIALIPTAGTIELTDEQKNNLYAPVDEALVEIRPDGLVYLPWMEYVTRLRKTFGLQWAIIPHGAPKAHGNYILWPFWMVIQGKLVAYAMGEQEYQPANRTMTWGDACEGAKSNALMRLCKNMGISLELWQPSFIRAWKSKHAETYEKKNRQGVLTTYWRRKGKGKPKDETDDPPLEKEEGPPPDEPQTIPATPA